VDGNYFHRCIHSVDETVVSEDSKIKVAHYRLSGELAFSGSSSGVIFEAILNRNPPAASTLNPKLPAKLEEVISKSLDKDREMRYQTAAELRGDLKRIKRGLESSRAHASVAGSSDSSGQISLPTPAQRSTFPRKRVFLTAAAAAAAALVVGVIAGGLLFKRPAPASLPTYRPLAFRRGIVRSARFTPDGKTVIYSAAWEGKPIALFSTRPESPQSRELDPPGADVLAISSTGEMALALKARPIEGFIYSGTLARVPLGGGAPREVMARFKSCSDNTLPGGNSSRFRPATSCAIARVDPSGDQSGRMGGSVSFALHPRVT